MAPNDSTALKALIDAFNDRRFADYVSAFAENAVIEYPQSGERIEGSKNMLAMFTAFATAPTFDVWRIDSAGDIAVVHAVGNYPGIEPLFVLLEYQFEAGKVVRETAYFGASFQAADWRKPYVRVESFKP